MFDKARAQMTPHKSLEIGCLLGVITPKAFDAEFTERASWVLNEPAVRDYYETYYPLLLPQMLRMRLRGVNTVVIPGDHEAAFSHFLNVISKLENDAGVDTFLWFLDDGSWGEYDIQSLIDVTRDPVAFVKRLRSTRTDRLTRSVDGLRTFFVFCAEFDALLAEQESNGMIPRYATSPAGATTTT